MSQISRKENASLFGPTVGDKIRLGDTDLYIEIEKDLRVYGDEAIYGGGKTLRDGMGMDNQLTSEGGALDLVITNVTVVDPILGVIKADVGIKDGKIVGVGKAGNPGTMDGVTPGLTVGPATDAITGEHLILTPAGNDGHIHLYLATTGLRGLEQRRHHLLRWRHRADRRHERHDHHLRTLEH